MENLAREIKGINFSLLIGVSSYLLANSFLDFVSSITLALLLGMLIGNLIRIPAGFQSGIGFTSGKLLELSILFLAFSINYSHIAEIGSGSFSIVFITVALMLLITFFLAKKLKCPESTGWLVGFGTTICGSSAIAALAPGVAKNKEDVGIAMAVVNLLGSIGMVILPFVLLALEMDPDKIGLILGGSLHSVGNVAGAAYPISNEVGEAAITIKLARVALLSPALIFFNFLVNRENSKSWRHYLKLPWYLWAFILITIATSFIEFPGSFIKAMDTGGKLVLTVAMAAIGLKISFRNLFQSGKRGIVFGVLVFAAELLILTVLVKLIL